jgi:hypothetical protein
VYTNILRCKNFSTAAWWKYLCIYIKGGIKHNIYQFWHELTVLVHCRLKTLVESTSPTLVSVGLVNGAPAFEFALCLARVHPVPVDAPFEKPGTTCSTIHAMAFVSPKPLIYKYQRKIIYGTYRHNCKCRNVCQNFYPHKLCTGYPIIGLLY